jgi:hypothetical protein
LKVLVEHADIHVHTVLFHTVDHLKQFIMS